MIRSVRVAVALALAAGATGCALQGGRAAAPDIGVVPGSASLPSPAAGSAAPARDLVATHSAKLGDLAAATGRLPVALRVPLLGIDAPVLGVGLAADGQLAVPDDLRRVGWYGAGAVPGDVGTALIAAHVDHAHRPGVFFRLDRLTPGAVLQVVHRDGTVSSFTVVARRMVAKPRLPVADLTRASGPPQLVLVTCGGSFDRGRRSYRDNILVYAVPTR